jgi:hypothetical protein
MVQQVGWITPDLIGGNPPLPHPKRRAALLDLNRRHLTSLRTFPHRNRVFPISACFETKSATADFVAGIQKATDESTAFLQVRARDSFGKS